jgi:hypothetical protein
MTKVTFLLILFLFNIVGLSVAQARVHEHAHTVKEELASATYEELGRTNHQQDEHKDCGASDCCRHCHNVIFINGPVRLITSAPSFLVSFREIKLQISENYFDIIKPPLV